MIDTHLNRQIKEYFFKKLLGKGNFGSVYLVEDINKKSLAACKVINKQKIAEVPKLGELVNNQIMVLYNCQDKNVVNYLTSFEDETFVYILMEYCNGGDLDQYTNGKGGKLSEEQAKHILNQILKGFKCIRAINAVHRDFKPENVLINNGIIKIADLGFSKILSDHQNKTNTVLGTLYTMAPQIISKKPYGSQCDIWSIGVVYYKLLFGTFPYMATSYAEMLKKIQFTRLDFPSTIPISNISKDFISRCLVMEPTQRITWQQIQSHSLFSNFPKMLSTMQNPQKSSQQIIKTLQYYIKSYSSLRIINPQPFPDASLSTAVKAEISKDPIQKKIVQKRLNTYYQKLYLGIRAYIISRNVFGVQRIQDLLGMVQLKNLILPQQHSFIGFIIARQTLRQITDLFDCLYKKQNIFQLPQSNQFFQSQQYKYLLQLLRNDQVTVASYITKFKPYLNKDDLLKIEISQPNPQQKVIQRQKRNIIQYSIQLFNHIDKINKKLVMNILILLQFLADQVESKYKSPEIYAAFGSNQDLKMIWTKTKETLARLKNNYQ